jgi:hypothetical protein
VPQNAKEFGAYRQHRSSTAMSIPSEELSWPSLQHRNFLGEFKTCNPTALRERLEFISKMSTRQAKQFETVSELINI